MITNPPRPTVLLIGASRGLGLAIAREYIRRGSSVVATIRSAPPTELHDLQDVADGRLEIEYIDITILEHIIALRDRLASRTFDLLFVNAGVTNSAEDTIADVSTEEFNRLVLTNALSPMRVIEALKDLVPLNGTIAIMSSGQGSITNNERGGFASVCLSPRQGSPRSLHPGERRRVRWTVDRRKACPVPADRRKPRAAWHPEGPHLDRGARHPSHELGDSWRCCCL
jgi:NAD(P)-dependent dehydrogenase (short-subunit alcohol dehydrogenase family)